MLLWQPWACSAACRRMSASSLPLITKSQSTPTSLHASVLPIAHLRVHTPQYELAKKRQVLFFRYHFHDLLPPSVAADDAQGALGNIEMLRQQLDEGGVGAAVLRRLRYHRTPSAVRGLLKTPLSRFRCDPDGQTHYKEDGSLFI